MRLTFILFVLFACNRPAPVAPSSPALQHNAAVDYAQTLLEGVACIATRTGIAGKPDTAICDFDTVLARCKVGRGAGSKCMPFADLTPPEQAPAPKAEASTPTTAAAPPKPDEKKPETKDKPKPKEK
jgi:hypothetical protein